VSLRWVTESDYDVLGHVMFDAVHKGRSLYTEAQRRAWAPAPRTGEGWRARLAPQHVLLAEADGVAQGFMSLVPNGYVDFAYIRPSFQGTGLFRRLFEAIQVRATELELTRLWTHASLMAQPAFAAVGFRPVRRETVELSGESLERFEMEKLLVG
jgi:putative acetyltransferase